MSNINEKYYERLFEQLLQSTADDFALMFFYNENPKFSYSENKNHLQICVEFIYRCLKCSLLKLDIGYENYGLGSLEGFAKKISERPLKWEIDDGLDTTLWIGEQVYGSELLDQIAEDCNLVAYEDEIDFADPRGLKFKEEIEKIFAQNGLPWDLKNPLFPIP